MARNFYKIIEKKNLWFLISFVVIFSGLSLMINRALNNEPVLNYGIDFAGGNTMMLTFDQLNDTIKSQDNSSSTIKKIHLDFIAQLQDTLALAQLENSFIQITQDHEVIIKTPILDHTISNQFQAILQESLGNYTILEIDFIGPAIGSELRQTSLWIIGAVFFILLFYISWRFEFNFGLAALAAVLHDGLVTISVASLLAIEINTAFVAAILTILGYSINDTIVVFDRIRENLPRYKEGFSVSDIANMSIYQTLTRSINTSVTTLLVIGCLLIFGGVTIKAFCLVLFIGIMAGTYSSIFIASPILASIYTPIEAD